MRSEEERIVRVPLPAGLIRHIDDLVRRRQGGFETREELIREAVQMMALELEYEGAPPAPRLPFSSGPAMGDPNVRRGEMDWTAGSGAFLSASSSRIANARARRSRFDDKDLSFTELRLGLPGPIAPPVTSHTVEQPLFGLHNRDYPTLWAAVQLAEMAAEKRALVALDEFQRTVLERAWEMGARITQFNPQAARRLAASFPTNPAKKQSAEDAFLNFVIGSVSANDAGRIVLEGPFFLWGIAGIERSGNFIGLTAAGYTLLQDLFGLQLRWNEGVMPSHERRWANVFVEHLKSHAPADWWGFDLTLHLIGREGTTRTVLVDEFHQALVRYWPRKPDPRTGDPRPWTRVQAATNTAGYVARAREWGLVDQRLAHGRYELTDFGLEHLSDES